MGRRLHQRQRLHTTILGAKSLKNLKFFRNQKQNTNPVYQYTLEDNPESLTLQDVLESHMTDPIELNSFDSMEKEAGIPFSNEKQRTAIKMALNENRKLVCIQGPPGTGKTFTLTLLLCRLIQQKKQVVVLAPTREALANIRMMTKKTLKRMGIKVHEHALMDTNEYRDVINKSDRALMAAEEVRDLRKAFDNGEITENVLDEMRQSIINRVRNEVGAEVIGNVRVAFATIGASFVDFVMKHKKFDPCLCIIDEAAQVMEAQTWPAVYKMKRIVMAGDPKQLPALVFTDEAKAFGLQNSVMDRILEKKNNFSWIMLENQYRSNAKIATWSNTCFYHNQLKTDVKCHEYSLHTILNPQPKKFRNLFDPLVLIDTSLERDVEKRLETYEHAVFDTNSINKTKQGFSYANLAEAKIAIGHYQRLLKYGVQPSDIAIITPYKGQTSLVTKLMEEFGAETGYTDFVQTTIGTVDSVQGKEYEVVIFTMVRSNPRKTMGFVSELRRLNVVITRAKRHFMFIGNGYLLAESKKDEIRKLYDCFKNAKRRFHPNNAFGEDGNVTDYVSNNFGQDLESFMNYSNDEEMINWCKRFNENGPDYRAKKALAWEKREETRLMKTISKVKYEYKRGSTEQLASELDQLDCSSN